MIDVIVAQLVAVLCCLFALGAAWFMDRQGIRHAAERELWRAERQLLQARALRPMPSARRPAAVEETGEEPVTNLERDAKLAQLRRLAGVLSVEEPQNRDIVPTDL